MINMAATPCERNPKWGPRHCSIYLAPYFAMNQQLQNLIKIPCKEMGCKIFEALASQNSGLVMAKKEQVAYAG